MADLRLGPPREAQKIFPIKLTSAGEVDLARNAKVMSGNRFRILTGIDPNPTNVSQCRWANGIAYLLEDCGRWSLEHVINWKGWCARST